MRNSDVLIGSLLLALAPIVIAETLVEVKLIAPMEEERGWCVDLMGGQANSILIGGVQAHTCYTYQGNGPSLDQAFVKEIITEQSEFRLANFDDKCMTVYEPVAGSFVSIETCDGRTAQQIVMNDDGRISPKTLPELCLTVGPASLPGGGARPLHIIRGLTFEACDTEISERQLWELRSEYDGPEETTMDRRFVINPNARPPGGGMGMGMGAGMGAQQ